MRNKQCGEEQGVREERGGQDEANGNGGGEGTLEKAFDQRDSMDGRADRGED